MKLSFSTRGWKDVSWEQFIEKASLMHYSGIEVYNVHSDSSLSGKGCPFHKYSVMGTSRNASIHSIDIPCLDSSEDISSADAQTITSIRRLFEFARDIRCPYISVLARDNDVEQIRGNIEALLPYAEACSVAILIKTGAAFADTKLLEALLDSYSSDCLAALWDVNQTFLAGESPYQTIVNLGANIKHIHLCDITETGEHRLVGEGSYPIGELISALRSLDFQGFISLEWLPEWLPELTDIDVILSHFEIYMRHLEDTHGHKKEHYLNFDGTGSYLWKQFEILDLTFSQVLDKLVKEFPDNTCFKYTTLNYTRSYAEFSNDVDNFARALVSMGVRKGSKVAIWATNVPAWYITFWATVKIGAVLVTVNTAYKIHEAEYLLRQSDTHTLVMVQGALDSHYDRIIDELCPELKSTRPGSPLHCKRLPQLRNVITVDFNMDGCLNFDEAMARSQMVSLLEINSMASKVSPNDVCNIQYTSGTTGFPKGVMLTHYNVINNGKCIGDRMGLSSADRMMIQVPMFHCFGMVLSMTSAITHSSMMCPMPYFSAKSSLACINQERITCFNGVPTMFIAMFNNPDFARTDFSHMRTGIMAGAGCPPELMRRAAANYPEGMNMRGIVSVYGQTESAPGSTMTDWQDPLDIRCETVGYPFPEVLCKIIDPDTGAELPAGMNGEFCSRGYNTMKGYYKMPQATASTVDKDGWLHSGDLACRDDNGCYRITGRLKDMIIRGGENIYPKEIEEFIYTFPKVRDVQVVGVPDSKYGEEALACVILKKGEDCTEDELRGFITSRLARHKVPRYIAFVDSFPMNAAGKVMKYKIREEFAEKLGLKK